MLTLTRKPGEKVVITHEPSGDRMVLDVCDFVFGSSIKMVFSAPRCFLIDRMEVHQDKQEKNQNVRVKRIQGNIDR